MTIDRSMPVLVVERRPAFVTLIERMLHELDFEHVESTSDAVLALKMLERDGPKIVISDLHLQSMSGLDLLRTVRADQRLERCPFLITAEAMKAFDARALKAAGVDGILLKPFRPNVLEPKLQVAFQRIARSHRHLRLTQRPSSSGLGRRLLYRVSN